MNAKQEIYYLVSENVKRDMKGMIKKLERFTELITAGVRMPSDNDIHVLARQLRGTAEQLNFELNKR